MPESAFAIFWQLYAWVGIKLYAWRGIPKLYAWVRYTEYAWLCSPLSSFFSLLCLWPEQAFLISIMVHSWCNNILTREVTQALPLKQGTSQTLEFLWSLTFEFQMIKRIHCSYIYVSIKMKTFSIQPKGIQKCR